MHRINRKASGLSAHMSVYSRTDARLDNPHAPSRTLGTIVRAARLECEPVARKGDYVPLRKRLG